MSHRNTPFTIIAALALAGIVGAAAPRAARGHSLLVVPQPRDQQDGYKDPPRAPPGTGAPCGIGRTVPPQPQTSFSPGQALHVQWSETVTHPGCFVIDFAASNDANFQILGVKSHAGATGGNPRPWSLDITLPNTSCPACTLRLRQLMLAADVPDNQCPPVTIPAGSTYYSCANITLGSNPASDAGSSGGTTGAGGAVTTTGAGGSAGAGQGAGTGASGSSGGCACRFGHAPGSWSVVAVMFAALVLRRRKQ